MIDISNFYIFIVVIKVHTRNKAADIYIGRACDVYNTVSTFVLVHYNRSSEDETGKNFKCLIYMMVQ